VASLSPIHNIATTLQKFFTLNYQSTTNNPLERVIILPFQITRDKECFQIKEKQIGIELKQKVSF